MTRDPIRVAYEQNGALDRDCPQCDAGPQQWCVDPRGRLRRVPCVLRTRIPGQVSRVVDADNPDRSGNNAEVVDFSEPRRPIDEGTSR
ncbi:hypothetical protein SAMN04488581_0397 [Mycolicibacterium neoaurum]|uniref:hypothetical protein n=1 Tax=Mycolicibacterium neoaurum TaxID=1795 RepID=UPI00055C90F6|nr:hypothetical protein [Mycolicibacterium neoaurum]SDC25701.1 hypothetical protein SAMN04488581_0397 [Mycolicibacterium neoaurum]